MKNLIKNAAMLMALLGGMHASHAQNYKNAGSALEMGSVEALQMEVTYDKTSHIIFPAGIRYVDLGSGNLSAGKAEDAGNVLRIKAATKDFEGETNFSVITEDGKFYTFDVCYNPAPEVLGYDLLKMRTGHGRIASDRVLFEDLGSSPPTLAGLLMETIFTKDKRSVKHLGSKGYGIRFAIKGLYVHQGKYYFHTEIHNSTGSPFRVDFLSFRVADKKVGRRAVAQDRPLVPLRSYRPLDDVKGHTHEANVFLLDHFTLSNDKELIIEVFEKHGNRNQAIHVEYSDLLRARELDGIHLKY
ncbi:conjugative transposon protein TraN [Flavobacterium sp. WW92]|uniref:conjugative transposon protein TraN n=1 Tax=unclassified Flavobacterium TaxID=196869 RepID=UPI002224A8E7|nr:MULTISPECIES: conjugative transposon protein TraN [unclassified Flavobacterium]WDO12305.1 conjugative transposon protein TraN [Flavobacterium sp. WW92]